MDEYKNINNAYIYGAIDVRWRFGGSSACGIIVHLYLLAYSQRTDVGGLYQLPALSISMFFTFSDHSMKKPDCSSRFTSPRDTNVI